MNKLEVARRHLGTALALFLEDRDPVSVHTLACAAGEVVDRLRGRRDGASFSSHALGLNPSMKPNEFWDLRHRHYNAFKHATDRKGEERDDQDILSGFNDEMNDDVLVLACLDYAPLAGTLPIEAQVFQIWYFAKAPQRLAPRVNRVPYLETFPGLDTMPREKQKTLLRQAVARYLVEPALREDPKTDLRPLMLGPP